MKFTFLETINPKTAPQIEYCIKQVFWIFVLMAFSRVFKSSTLIWIVLKTGIDEIGEIPGTDVSSLSEIAVLLIVDFIILTIAIIFFRWKKSLIAAVIILLIALGTVYNIGEAYFIHEFAKIKTTQIILSAFYLIFAVIGVLATYRWRRVKPS